MIKFSLGKAWVRVESLRWGARKHLLSHWVEGLVGWEVGLAGTCQMTGLVVGRVERAGRLIVLTLHLN